MGEQLERKTVGATITKALDDGTFEAAIATFGEVDSDGDIVEPGAFGDRPASVLPAHRSEHVPLGKTRVEERGDVAVAVGRFNLEIAAARDWHSSLKFDLANPPAVQEWSWGYRVLEDRRDTVNGEPVRRLIKVDLREVSPVLRGASVGTGTLSVKHLKGDGLSFEDLREMLEQALTEAEGDDVEWLHVSDLVDDRVIYRRRLNDEPPQLLERGYTLDDDGAVQLGGDPLEVVMRRTYEPAKSTGSDLPKLADRIRLAQFDVESLVHEIRVTSEGRKARGRRLGEDVRGATVEMAHGCSALLDELSRTIDRHVSPDDAVAQAAARFQASEMLRRGIKA